MTEHTTEVNGVTLFYITAGEGRPVILLHGNGESHELFGTQTEQLVREGYQVIAPDSRGQGRSSQVHEFHYADMAEDIYQLIEKLGLEKPAVYGFSDGGIIALLLEILHPGTVGILALSGANLSPAGVDPDFTSQFEGNDDPLIRLMFTEPDIDPEDLKKFDMPVLVMAGSEDLILPEETDRIAKALPHSELVIVDGADHGSYIVGSETAGEILIPFLKKHGY